MSRRFFQLTIVLTAVIMASCADQRHGPPLADEIQKNVASRASISCDDVEAHYRIAEGVRAGLEIQKYRGHILRELTGWSAPPMKLSEARSFSSQSAQLLRDELKRRCPKNRISGNEDIVYIPS